MNRKPLAIVIDYDDTTVSFSGYLCRWHNKLHQTHLTEHDLISWEFPPELEETFRNWEELLYARLPLLSGARETLVCFKALGYKVIIMTARDEKFRNVTEFNIKDNDLPYDEIIFSTNKAKDIRKLAQTYNVQIFADDNVKTVKDVFKNTNVNEVYLIETSVNKNIKIDKEIHRIGSIRQILMSDTKELSPWN